LIDWFAGKLRDPEAPTIDTRIVDVHRQGPARLSDYLRDSNQSPKGYRPEELQQTGMVFALTIRLRGERGQRFPLRWAVVDIDRESRLPGRSFNQRPGEEPVVFQPRNDDHARTWPVWVPYPPKPGRYRVTFMLNNAKYQPVSQRSGAAFTVPARGDSA
jgi:hypothetical protein